MQTATNPQTGEKVQWNGQTWVPLGGSAMPAQPTQQPGVQIVGSQRPKPPAAPPSEYEQGQDVIQNQNSSFDNRSNLRKEFNALQSVKDYGSTMGALGSMWVAPNNAQGDLAVIYGFAKAMDPGSVVREGEMDMANSTSSYVQDLYRRFGQIAEGNRLPPEVRKQLIQSAMGKGKAFDGAYNQDRARYRGIAERSNFAPEDIIGPHIGDAYRDEGAVYDRRNAPPPISNEQLDAELAKKIASRESPAAIIKWLQDNGQPITDDTIAQITANVGNPNPQIDRDSPNEHALKAGVGDLVEGAGDVLGLVGNPLNAGINAIAGTNLSTDLGQTLRDATGLPQGDPMASAINKGGIAALTGAGAARAVPGAVAEQIAAQPIRQGLAGMAAGGASEGANQQGYGPGVQALAGLAGGMGAYGGTNALLKVGGGSAPSEVAQAATRQGVNMMPADVGGPTTRRLTAAAAQTPLSAEPVVNAAKRAQEQLGEAVQRTARSAGAKMEPDDAGEAVRRAGQAYVPKQSARIGRVYDRAAERAKGVKIKPVGAIKVIDDQIARLGDTGEMSAPLVRDLQSIRRSIESGVSVSGMRDVRTILSQGVYDGKLRSGQEKAVYKQVIDAVAGDIETGLRVAGKKDALNLFNVADKAWKERVDYIDDVLEPVIGIKKSGEDILNAIEGMAKGAKGGISRLSGVLRELPEETVGNIRATIIDRLGKATKGQQDDTGNAFSSGTFLTRWSDLSPKGKAALFGDGDLRRNLDDIAKLSAQVKESSKYANSSNTSGGVMGNVGALSLAALSYPKTAITAGILQHVTGKLMASKGFASWLARTPNNPALLDRHAGQLTQIAAREPIIANDIGSVQTWLNQQLGTVSRAAASGTDPDRK